MSELTPNLKLFKYNTETDAKQPFSINDCMNANWDKIDASLGSLEICDIGMALYVDETKGLRRYLNGQVVDINTNTQAFLNRLLEIKNTNPDYFTDEATWQSETTLNIDGCVYKFVLNYSGDNVVSVRLPKYPDYAEINAGGTLPVVGNGMTLGFTNGTYNFGLAVNGSSGNSDTFWASAYGEPVGTIGAHSVETPNRSSMGVTTDPTKSGIQTTLKQTKLKMRYFIQIATGSETENNIINDIELNNPYSLFDSKYSDHELNNLSWLKSEGQWNAKAVYPTAYDKLLKVYNGTETVAGLSVKLSTETYTDYDFVLNTADETFRLPLKTKLASGKAVAGNGMTLGLTNGIDTFPVYTALNTGNNGSSGFLQSRGDYNNYTNLNQAIPAKQNPYPTDQRTIGIATDPTKSGLELSDSGLYLYFYVGETVQNANLIDAGRIGEQLASLIPNNSNLITSYCCPDWNNGITAETSLKVEKTFVAPSNGIISYSLSAFNEGNAYIKVNEITILQSMGNNNPDFNSLTGTMIVSGGDVVKYYSSYTYTDFNSQNIIFFPMKGAN